MTAIGWRTTLRLVALTGILATIVAVPAVTYAQASVEGHAVYAGYAIVAPMAYLVPGVVLLLRRHWHVVGWLLCLVAVAMAFSFGSDWSAVTFGGAWLLWVLDLFEGSLFWLPFVALLVAFPDGLADRDRRARLVGWSVLTVAAAAVVPEMLMTDVGIEGVRTVPNPLPFAFLSRSVGDLAGIIEFGALAVAFAGMVRRYRSSGVLARRQYRWVLSALVLLVAALVIGLVGSTISGDDEGPWWWPLMIGYVALPVAFMVAILRYRLYEIDRLISRTVTYSTVVVVLGSTYLGTVALLAQVLPDGGDLAVAVSTLGAAAVVRPVHLRVQRVVDRRFNRPRFDAERELEGFTRRVRDQTDLAVVQSDLRHVVDHTLHPATMAVWLRP